MKSSALKADMLPPSEIRLAATDVVRIHVGATAADVVVEVTRVFGFKRAGPDLKRVIEAEIRRMLYDDVRGKAALRLATGWRPESHAA